MLLSNAHPSLVYDMASKYCNIKGKGRSPPPDYPRLLPTYAQNEKNLLEEKQQDQNSTLNDYWYFRQ